MFDFLVLSAAKPLPAKATTSQRKIIRLANKVAALKQFRDLRDKIAAAKSTIPMAIQSGLFMLNATHKPDELLEAIVMVKSKLSELERDSSKVVSKIGVL